MMDIVKYLRSIDEPTAADLIEQQAARIKELETANTLVRARLEHEAKQAAERMVDLDDVRNELTALRAENAELRKDAERYRFAKDWFVLLVCNEGTEDEYTEIAFGGNGPTDLVGKFDGIDAAIDAAMALPE